jgi:hypothetical protein
MDALAPGTPTAIAFPAGARVATQAAAVDRPWLTFGFAFAAVLAIQLLTGAYGVERGGYSDDAAHLMNGLVFRDYLVSGFHETPMAFAERYYQSYPKIAPLMWPPLFHVTLGVLLLPGWAPGAMALVFMALITAWLNWRLLRIAQKLCGGLSPWLAVMVVITTPLLAALSGTVMLDLAIAALSLEGTYWLASYASTGRTRDAVFFGLCATGACLTKGNGVAVTLAPVAFIVLAGRFDLLRRSGLYIAAALVLGIAVPLLALSASYDSAIGDFGGVTARDVFDRVGFYCLQLWQQLGPVTIGFAAIGLVEVWRSRRAREGTAPLGVALVSLLVSAAMFHWLNPHKTVAGRYITVAVAPIVTLAFVGAGVAAFRAYPVYWRRPLRRIAAISIVAMAFMWRPAPRPVEPIGYRALVRDMVSEGWIAGRRVLIVSDEIGEGAFVTEAALTRPHDAPTIVRGSKLLGTDNWNGQNFKLTYASPEAMYRDLEAMHMDFVVLDRSDRSTRLPYFSQAAALVTEGRIVRLASNDATRSAPVARLLELYRVPTRTPGDPKAPPGRTSGAPR